MRYAKKVKDDPTKSPMYELDLQRETHLELNLEEHPFGLGKKLVVAPRSLSLLDFSYSVR